MIQAEVGADYVVQKSVVLGFVDRRQERPRRPAARRQQFLASSRAGPAVGAPVHDERDARARRLHDEARGRGRRPCRVGGAPGSCRPRFCRGDRLSDLVVGGTGSAKPAMPPPVGPTIRTDYVQGVVEAYGAAAADVRGRLEIANRPTALHPSQRRWPSLGQRPCCLDAGPADSGPARRPVCPACGARGAERSRAHHHSIVRETVGATSGLRLDRCRVLPGTSRTSARRRRRLLRRGLPRRGRPGGTRRALAFARGARASISAVVSMIDAGCGSTSSSASKPVSIDSNAASTPPASMTSATGSPTGSALRCTGSACRWSWPPWNTRRPPRRSRSIRIKPSCWHARSRSISPPKP